MRQEAETNPSDATDIPYAVPCIYMQYAITRYTIYDTLLVY